MSILCEFKDEDGSDIGLERAHSFPLGLVGWRGEEATEVGEVPIGLRPLATDRSMTHVNIDVSILDDENKKVYIVNLAPLSDLRLIEVRVLSGPDRMTQPHIFFSWLPISKDYHQMLFDWSAEDIFKSDPFTSPARNGKLPRLFHRRLLFNLTT